LLVHVLHAVFLAHASRVVPSGVTACPAGQPVTLGRIAHLRTAPLGQVQR
jgi:hypothetical protein